MRVALVNMPFSSVRPALGVSLLKSQLERIGASARVEYLNIRFADLVGGPTAWYISELAPSQILAGEFVFASHLFDGLAGTERAYIAMVRERFGSVVTDGDLRRVLRARSLAGQFLDECLTSIPWGTYDVVGFSSTFTQNVSSLALAKRLRAAFPHLVLVLGGANCEATMGLQLHRSFPFLDHVATGEADISFPRLIEGLMHGSDVADIPGIVSRVDGDSVFRSLTPERVASMDDLPYPDYEDFYAAYAAARPGGTRPRVIMETSRGCWWGEKHHCTFCGLNGLAMTFRSKSPERAMEECIALTTKYGTTEVEMVDNILDWRYLRTFLPALRDRGLGIDLFYETKANLTRAQVELMRDAGITAIQPGIESLSSAVLKLMNKGTTAIQNIQLLKWCKELGIKSHWNLLYGFPREEPSEYESMVGVMDRLHHLDPPQAAFGIRLDRFSPHFMAPAEFGIVNVRPDPSYGFAYDLPDAAIGELAYYFESDHADGRDPESYVGPAMASVQRWQAAASGDAPSSLRLHDDGRELLVSDRRDGLHADVRLADLDRELYRFCDQGRSGEQLARQAEACGASADQAASFATRMVEAGLMIHLDERYLSLAVDDAGRDRGFPSEPSDDDITTRTRIAVPLARS